MNLWGPPGSRMTSPVWCSAADSFTPAVISCQFSVVSFP
jgi:hypothetical protein